MSCSLVETIVAAGLVASVALGVAQLFAATTDANRRAARRTTMTIFAIQKIEELRTPERDAADGVEALDAAGRPVGAADAVYVRRWSIRPLSSDPDHLLIVQVQVTSLRSGDARIVAVRRRKS